MFLVQWIPYLCIEYTCSCTVVEGIATVTGLEQTYVYVSNICTCKQVINILLRVVPVYTILESLLNVGSWHLYMYRYRQAGTDSRIQ